MVPQDVFVKLICLAPVNEFGCGFAAADALVAAGFFVKRHTAGGNVGDLFEFEFAFLIAAPHSADEAGFVLCGLNEIFGLCAGVGHCTAAFVCVLVKTLFKFTKEFGNLVCEFIERYKVLFAVVTAYYYALVFGDIAGAEFDAERNALHLIVEYEWICK